MCDSFDTMRIKLVVTEANYRLRDKCFEAIGNGKQRGVI